jgi:hypothetical protein
MVKFYARAFFQYKTGLTGPMSVDLHKISYIWGSGE